MPKFTLKKVSSCQKLKQNRLGVFPTSPPDHLNTHRKLFPINHLITDLVTAQVGQSESGAAVFFRKDASMASIFEQHWKKTNEKKHAEISAELGSA